MLIYRTSLCLSLILCVNLLIGQVDYWSVAKKSNLTENNRTRSITEFDLYELQIETFTNMIPSKGDAPAQIMLPSTKGELSSFQIWDAPIMESELAAKFPNIRTFLVQNMENPTEHGRLSVTSAGVNAYISSLEGSYVISPVEDGENIYTVFKKSAQKLSGEFTCGVKGEEIKDELEASQRSFVQIGDEIRVFRLAVSTTGEYADFHGGNVNAVMEAIVETVNIVNVVYENDFALRFIIVNNNDLLINLDSDTDPFTNTENGAGQMLTANPGFINSILSPTDYDIGHVFATAGAGLASLRSSCGGNKARGITGIFPPEGNTFAIDYVAHELGHQLGSQHTFNNCPGQEVPNFAYEPGGGTTIMAYAGICGNNNLQTSSDPYFHVSSLIQISNWIGGTGGNCAETTPSGNTAPVVDAGEGNFFIPTETPFKLTAEGDDADGDEITYCWEQYNLGPASPLGSPLGTAPRFRSTDPSPIPTRFFPALRTVVTGTFNSSEILPTESQGLSFQCTVRDNKVGGGAASWDLMSFNTTDEAGPFVVTSQTENTVVWETNNLATVTWDVANTDQAPVDCQKVNIILSTTFGVTFNVMLAENADNNGTHTFFVPEEAVTNFAYVMVEAADNVFYNVNSTSFRVIPGISSSVDQAFQNSIEVFPNPTQGSITLDMNTTNGEDINVEVIDVQGRTLNNYVKNTQVSNIEMNVPSGVYFLRITQANQLAFKKVVVTE